MNTHKRGYFVIVFVFVLLISASPFSVFAQEGDGDLTRLEEAEFQASRGLASMALRAFDAGQHEQALLLALEALEAYPYTAQAESALANIVDGYVPTTHVSLTAVRFYVWSPDGARIALGGSAAFGEGTVDDNIQIVPADDLRAEAALVDLSLEAAGCVPLEMAWSPDGTALASVYIRGEYGTDPCFAPPTVWDVNTGDVVVQFTGHESETGVLSIAWSQDGAMVLTTGEDGSAQIWDAVTGEEVFVLTGHTGAVTDGAWSPDGALIATASLDGSVRIWDAVTGEEQKNYSGYLGGMTALDWALNGTQLVVASVDGLARVIDVASGELLLNLMGHAGGLSAVGFDPSNQWIATASAGDGTARIWNASTGKEVMILRGLGGGLNGVEWSPDGCQFAVDGPKIFTIWQLSLGSLTLTGHSGPVSDGAWSPDGSLIATSSADNTARIWDATTGEELFTLDHGNRLFYMDWSPDGTQIATSSVGGMARVWDVMTGELVREEQISPADTVLFSVRWSRDGTKIVQGSLTGQNTVWDPLTGEVVAQLDFDAAVALLGSEGFCIPFGPSWSLDSSKIATGCPTGAEEPGAGVLIWDAETGELLTSFEQVHNGAARTDWSPDGTRIAAATGSTARSDGSITVWDAETGELLQTFAGHSTFSYGLSWSPDGARIATGDLDGMVRIWNSNTGDEVLNFQAPGNVTTTSWSPDGMYIMASGSYASPIIRRVWPSTQALIDHAYDCCVTRALTPEERAQYGLSQ